MLPTEIAKRLKQLGFNEECLAYYSNEHFYLLGDQGIKQSSWDRTNKIRSENCISAPLWQQAIDWLRESKNIHLCYNPHFTTSGTVAGYMFDVYSFSDLLGRQESERTINGVTYQQAREQAILKALELISK